MPSDPSRASTIVSLAEALAKGPPPPGNLAVPIFADGWSDVDTPGASLVLAAGMAITVAGLFGAVAVAAAGALVARTRHRIGEMPWSD